MTDEQLDQFIYEDLPSALFHVTPTDIDDESGGSLEEVILIKMLAHNPGVLKHKPLQWWIDHYLNMKS